MSTYARSIHLSGGAIVTINLDDPAAVAYAFAQAGPSQTLGSAFDVIGLARTRRRFRRRGDDRAAAAPGPESRGESDRWRRRRGGGEDVLRVRDMRGVRPAVLLAAVPRSRVPRARGDACGNATASTACPVCDRE